MKPQLQKYLASNPDNIPGDCHRTCVAMILNMDRDDVPHFMQDCRPGLPPEHRNWIAAEAAERDWLEQFGLTVVNYGYDSSFELTDVLNMMRNLRNGPVILGCQSENGDHSVVIHNGEVVNPHGEGVIVGPMSTGFWHITAYSVGDNYRPRKMNTWLSRLARLVWPHRRQPNGD